MAIIVNYCLFQVLYCMPPPFSTGLALCRLAQADLPTSVITTLVSHFGGLFLSPILLYLMVNLMFLHRSFKYFYIFFLLEKENILYSIFSFIIYFLLNFVCILSFSLAYIFLPFFP